MGEKDPQGEWGQDQEEGTDPSVIEVLIVNSQNSIQGKRKDLEGVPTDPGPGARIPIGPKRIPVMPPEQEGVKRVSHKYGVAHIPGSGDDQGDQAELCRMCKCL